MSKSKGEFLTLSLLENKGYKALAYRFFCLGSHYRKQLVFSYTSLDTAMSSYEKLLNKVKSIKKDDSKIAEDVIHSYKERFSLSLEDDLNTANALTALFDMLKDDSLNNNTKLFLVEDFDKVLSLDLLKEDKTMADESFVKEIEALINLRNVAKNEKNYEKADQIRNELLIKGVVIKDGREGTTYEIKEVK
jgi:cysteinyl-tRNA synthetase